MPIARSCGRLIPSLLVASQLVPSNCRFLELLTMASERGKPIGLTAKHNVLIVLRDVLRMACTRPLNGRRSHACRRTKCRTSIALEVHWAFGCRDGYWPSRGGKCGKPRRPQVSHNWAQRISSTEKRDSDGVGTRCFVLKLGCRCR